MVKGETVTIPEFEIVSSPRISLKDIKNYKYKPLYEARKTLTEEELEETRIANKCW